MRNVSCNQKMKLFLEHKFESTFEIKPSEFKERLGAHVEKPNILSYIRSKKSKSFYGEVNDGYFKIWRIVNKRKGSMPNLEGQFRDHSCGTKVLVKMRPDREVFTLVIVWTIGTLSLALFAALYYGSLQLTTISSLLLFIFGNFLFYQYFWSEVPKSKAKFFEIVQSETANKANSADAKSRAAD